MHIILMSCKFGPYAPKVLPPVSMPALAWASINDIWPLLSWPTVTLLILEEVNVLGCGGNHMLVRPPVIQYCQLTGMICLLDRPVWRLRGVIYRLGNSCMHLWFWLDFWQLQTLHISEWQCGKRYHVVPFQWCPFLFYVAFRNDIEDWCACSTNSYK